MLSVATWNLENLFRPGTPDGPPTDAAYDAKLARLAETVDALAVDVLAVQEVGQPEALADLVARLAPPPGGGPWRTALSAHPDDRGIRVGVLTGLPIESSTDVVDLPPPLRPVQVDDAGDPAAAMGRGALLASLDVRGTRLDVLTCHLKSKLLSYPGGRFTPRTEDERARYGAYAVFRRAAEAAALRVAANAALAGEGRTRRLALLGDLNDSEEAATTQVLLGPGGSQLGTPGADTPDKGDAWRLWNLAPLVPVERRYSRVYRGRGELIDHVLVSAALLAEVDGLEIHHDGPLPSVTEDPSTRRGAAASDHAPVVVRLRTG